MASRRWLLFTGTIALALGMTMPALAQGNGNGKGNGNGGGDDGGEEAVTDNVFSLEIRQTANLQGDLPEPLDPALSRYVDQRLVHLDPAASPCVTGNQQNTRGKDRRYGAFVDLDRGSATASDPDRNDCNEVHALPATERRTFTMVIPPERGAPPGVSCACDVLGAATDGDGSCTVTPDVVGALGVPDDADPAVSALEVVGNRDDQTYLFLHWRTPRGDGTFANYSLRSTSPLPFTTTPDGDTQRIQFLTDPLDPSEDFEFLDPEARCQGSFPFEMDVTLVLQQCTLGADGRCEAPAGSGG